MDRLVAVGQMSTGMRRCTLQCAHSQLSVVDREHHPKTRMPWRINRVCQMQ
ncbi:hypothetical protein PHET_10239 [Paragonimus heterotremus]|uniref:Uncharacterized protein n=1 Tax=Paragonimus heterotremus TaxID=100268 RepID=A0A8J4WE13_9TREM|nr:hypothetical protein PHET_10239 [Paragonimus heterotremus]